MIEFLKAQIRAHALKEKPNEACGFVFSKNMAEPMVNISETPRNTFQIDPLKYLEAKRTGKLTAYYHSHPSSDSKPSVADKAVAEELQLPLYIYSVPFDTMDLYIPNGYEVPLEGRAFVLGVHDCAGLVVDYYRQRLGIRIDNFSRDISNVANGFADLVKFARNQGFILTDSPLEHDIVAMKIGRPAYPNHVGVILKSGTMLHQLVSRTSQTVVYGGYWKRNTHLILRHQTLT